MSSNPPDSQRSRNSTHAGNGSYGSTPTQGAEPLKVQLGEHLDSATRRSLQSAQRPGSSMFEIAKRNPVPLLLAVGGLVWMLTSLRGFRRR